MKLLIFLSLVFSFFVSLAFADEPCRDPSKWSITVVKCEHCKYCDNLTNDFKSDAELKPLADLVNFTTCAAEDDAAMARFKHVEFNGYPALIIERPANEKRDPQAKFDSWLFTGYDRRPRKLAATLRLIIQPAIAPVKAVKRTVATGFKRVVPTKQNR